MWNLRFDNLLNETNLLGQRITQLNVRRRQWGTIKTMFSWKGRAIQKEVDDLFARWDRINSILTRAVARRSKYIMDMMDRRASDGQRS